jgi:O-antigen/teichoic acid export membrane protein
MTNQVEIVSRGTLGVENPAEPSHCDPAAVAHRRVLRDALNYFLSKIVPGLMGFLSVIVFVRVLGVGEYGRYAVVAAFVMASGSALAAWLSQGMLRFHSRWRSSNRAADFLRSVSVGTILSVLLGSAVLGTALPLTGVQRGWPVLISLGLFIALVLYTVSLARFQASLRSRDVLQIEAWRSVGTFAIPLTLIWLTRLRDYRPLLLGIALGYTMPLLVPIVNKARIHIEDMRRGGQILTAWQRDVLRQLWSFGWPMALWMFCQQCLAVSDRFFIQRFWGNAEAGVYSSMYDTVVRSLSLVFMPATLAIHPIVMNHWNQGNHGPALRAIRSGIKYQVLMFLPVGVLLVVFAPRVSRMILGKWDAEAASIVLPLALGGFLWQVCLLAHKPLEILCETRRMLVGALAALAINVIGNWLLVVPYGYRASAYVTIATSVTYLVLLYRLTPMKALRHGSIAESGVAPSDF